MRIAVASGKGGTGKTTIATSLALSLNTTRTMVLDCDVEAPNAHLFLNPTFERREEVGILIPQVDEGRCSFCGRCAEVCQFYAIAVIGKLCHGCGSCTLNCPEQAIGEQLDVLGIMEAGPTPTGVYFARGVMKVGEPMAVPIIRELKKWDIEGGGTSFSRQDETYDWETIILDAPPGTSCPGVESLHGADFVVLVTEPTPFGLHDLRLMVEVVHELDIPVGVVINRDGTGDAEVDKFCAEADLPVLMRIPLDRSIGAGIAQGKPLVAIRPEYTDHFRDLYRRILDIVQKAEL